MIFAVGRTSPDTPLFGFSAIARSVMIFANSLAEESFPEVLGFSAIARSVMIFACAAQLFEEKKG